jgi:single-strand DNA-binding protein
MYNKIVIVGNLGRDPERKGGDRGPVTFSVATSERWRSNEGEDKEETQWHECTAWGKLGDVCLQILAKGDRALVEGALEYNEYEGKKYARIKMREMKKLSPRREGGQPSRGSWGQAQPDQGGWGQAQPPAQPQPPTQPQPPAQPNQGGWGQPPPNQGGWTQPQPPAQPPIQHKTSHVAQPTGDDPIPF